MTDRVRATLEPALGLLLFAAALVLLRHELRAYDYHQIVADVARLAWSQVGLALALTALNYLVLTGYDVLSLRFVGRPLPYRQVAFASFVSYVLSHNAGFLGGGAARFRFYSGWGLSAGEIARVVGLNAVTFWIGYLALLGVALVIEPPALPHAIATPVHAAPLAGLACLAAVGGYFLVTTLRRAPIRWRRWELRVPSSGLALRQLVVSAIDWALVASVLFVLLPSAARVSFLPFVAMFLVAQIAAVASHVPGGVGVFEVVMLAFLAPAAPTSALLGSLVVYRCIYYLLPLVVAAAIFGGYELMRRRGFAEAQAEHDVARRASAARFGRALVGWVPGIMPEVMASATFLAGVVLLASGAMRPAFGRLAWLERVLPLPVVEVSHFLGSLAGVGLLLLARGLQRRLDGAWALAVALLAAGVALSLLKGLDWAEATVLGLSLAALLPCRREFYRKSSMLDEPFSAQWTMAVAVVVLGVGWLLLFSYKHVEYSHDLWWQFEFSAAAPRSLRATVGALVLLLGYGGATLLRPAPPDAARPSERILTEVQTIVSASRDTSAHLALLGDKQFLMNERRSAFLMYGISRRAWVALRDPVGTPDEARELARRFRELSDRHDGWTVFYEIGPHQLPLYLDLGLTLVKLGEEGRVPLETFVLEGRAHKSLRRTHRQVENEGCRFEIVPPGGVDPLLADLRQVSDAWLAQKHTREKGFSLGFFAPAYLQRCPIAVVRHRDRIVAFANLLLGAGRGELSIDLMRYAPDAPPGLMDFLFVELLLWGKAEGYQWFNLGMAPFSGLEAHALAPLSTRLGAFLYRHGERFYNFRGLRQYKEKFDPVWQPRYLACPGGLALPRVLANVGALISGGLKGIVAR